MQEYLKILNRSTTKLNYWLKRIWKKIDENIEISL